MVTCPNGHHNPAGFDLCGECGAPIEETGAESAVWYRTKWALIGASGVVALVVLAASVVLAMDRGSDRSETTAATPTGQEAIPQWWATAHTPVTELRQSLTDAMRSLDRMDSVGLENSCQNMHDLAGVDVHTYLPAPVPEITSELAAAAEDAHAAAHMCLSLAAGSQNTYNGEFLAAVEQAERRLVHAQELVNDALLNNQ
ncbi:hypothetical protein ABGB19_01380 [Mycobacterium sp. B14F4]|uniref:hypothetical protein n=1 Tax=Mycobacterium sp. B14F4 TaxID=3153565 RepID=UPI00325E75B3